MKSRALKCQCKQINTCLDLFPLCLFLPEIIFAKVILRIQYINWKKLPFAWLLVQTLVTQAKTTKIWNYLSFVPKTLKYWVGVQWGQSCCIGRKCLFSIGWSPFYWWCHNKNALWGRCFTSTSFAPHLFLLDWLKLNLALLLDQFRLA